jgi:hypothetical protein
MDLDKIKEIQKKLVVINNYVSSELNKIYEDLNKIKKCQN